MEVVSIFMRNNLNELERVLLEYVRDFDEYDSFNHEELFTKEDREGLKNGYTINKLIPYDFGPEYLELNIELKEGSIQEYFYTHKDSTKLHNVNSFISVDTLVFIDEEMNQPEIETMLDIVKRVKHNGYILLRDNSDNYLVGKRVIEVNEDGPVIGFDIDKPIEEFTTEEVLKTYYNDFYLLSEHSAELKGIMDRSIFDSRNYHNEEIANYLFDIIDSGVIDLKEDVTYLASFFDSIKSTEDTLFLSSLNDRVEEARSGHRYQSLFDSLIIGIKADKLNLEFKTFDSIYFIFDDIYRQKSFIVPDEDFKVKHNVNTDNKIMVAEPDFDLDRILDYIRQNNLYAKHDKVVYNDITPEEHFEYADIGNRFLR